jgi:dTDP-4-amino-4,6-dideoxygalactose transaminase
MGFKPRYSKAAPRRSGSIAGTASRPPSASAETGALAGFGLYSHSRTALRFGLAASGLRDGDRVLVPDFICDALVLPLEQSKLVPVYFPIGQDLQPRWPALEALADFAARALVMVHYFGVPQSVDRYREFCRKHGLILIEDNAHGFGGDFEGARLGTIGEIGISSPWKNFPVRNGALLHLAGRTDTAYERLPPEPRRLLPTKRQIWSLVEPGWRHQCRHYGHGLQSVEPTAAMPAWRMDRSDAAFLSKQDLKAGAAQRRALYDVWREWCARSGLDPAIERLTGEESPLLFAAYCRSADHRHAMLEWLWHRQIEAHTWPKLPPTVLDGTGEAKAYWERMVCLPIHQQMSVSGLAGFLDSCGPAP